MDFKFVTDFKLSTKTFSQITDFVKAETTSPYLIEARKIKPKEVVKNVFKSSKDEEGIKNPFKNISDQKNDSYEEAKTESSERLNEELEDKDYEEVGGLAIEFIDFIIDKLFIFLGRNPQKNNSLTESKKKRLKMLIGKIMQKHEVKLSIEFVAVVMFGAYVNAKWASSKKIEDEDQEKVNNKVIKKPIKNLKNENPKVIKINQKEIKKSNKKGLVNY